MTRHKKRNTIELNTPPMFEDKITISKRTAFPDKKAKDLFFQHLSNDPIKTAVLLNTEFRTRQCFFCPVQHVGYNKKIFRAILDNPNIISLSLSREYSFFYRPGEWGFETFDSMSSLKELTLGIYESYLQDERFLKGLQSYLTSPDCTLQKLVIPHIGWNSDQLRDLKLAFEGATSLQTYEGSSQKILQEILDKKNKNTNSHQENQDSDSEFDFRV